MRKYLNYHKKNKLVFSRNRNKKNENKKYYKLYICSIFLNILKKKICDKKITLESELKNKILINHCAA